MALEGSSILPPNMRTATLTWPWAARWALLAVAVGALAGNSRLCRAAEPSDLEKAEQLIREGNALRRNNQDARALPMFQQAYGLSRTPRSAAQLGLAELALGYWDAASEHLNEALTSGRNPWVERNRSTIEASLKEAKSHLASLTVKGRPVGAEVVLNGKSVGTLPLGGPVLVNEGRIETEVRAPGYKSDRRVLTVDGGSSAEVGVDLDRLPAASEHPAEPTRTTAAAADSATADARPSADAQTKQSDAGASATELPTWRRALPWVAAAGALAAGGIGVWQAVRASKSLDQFDALGNMACGATQPMRGSDPSCAGLYNDWSNHRTNAWIAFAAAGVLGAGAAGLFIWNAYAAPVDVQVGVGTAQITFRRSF